MNDAAVISFVFLRMANLTINLAQLQDKIKRDPTGYQDEFDTQYHRFIYSADFIDIITDISDIVCWRVI